MFKVLGNAWKIEELRKKILFTLLILFIYRLGCFVPVPGVNVSYIQEMVGEYSALSFLDLFSGGSLSNMTLFALGVMPYINASIIMNLLCVAIPALERMTKEGDDGRRKITKITRIVTLILAVIQSAGIMLSMGSSAMISADFFSYLVVVLTLTAGSCLVMWMGERVNEKGIGNGISLIIFINILSSFPGYIWTIGQNVALGTTAWYVPVILIVIARAIITLITYMDMGERRIPVQYAKRVVGRKQYGGQSTYIPMKVNASGVMPLIFAITFIQFPYMLCQIFWPDSAFFNWYTKWLAAGSLIYMVVYFLLILFFSYFYSQISFNPIDVANNMQQYGGFIPGIRPGRPTSEYLSKILSKITFFGAIFLAIVAAVPTVFSSATGVASAFGATSLLIIVSVALETIRQIESQMMMRHYKGFLK